MALKKVETSINECTNNNINTTDNSIDVLTKTVQILSKQHEMDTKRIDYLEQKISEMNDDILFLKNEIKALVSTKNIDINGNNMNSIELKDSKINDDNDDDSDHDRSIQWGLMDKGMHTIGRYIMKHNDDTKKDFLGTCASNLNCFSKEKFVDGKHVIRIKINKRGQKVWNGFQFGIIKTDSIELNTNKDVFNLKDSIVYYRDCIKVNNNGYIKEKRSMKFIGDKVGQIIKIELDMDNKNVSFYCGDIKQKTLDIDGNSYNICCGLYEFNDEIEIL